MAKHILEVKFSLSNVQDKKEIKRTLCALLNTNGGKIVLKANDAEADSKIVADNVIRPIEQYFGSIIGPYEVHNAFQVLEEKCDTITLGVQALPILCTLNTNLLVPTNTEIRQISCMEQDALRRMLFERRTAEDFTHKMPERFFSGCECGFRESKTIQFKLLKTEKTRNTDFADRVINNKFTEIISGFANATGGYIFYGINDNGIVEGELLSESQRRETTEKLEIEVGTMIWQDKSKKVVRGREWDIKFVAVKDCENKTIPSTFVMVVTVKPYIGGVFAKEPESYYLKDGKVEKMSFDSWRRNTYHKVATPVQESIKRSSWSSEKNRRNYMKITQKLEKLRQLGNWEQIKEIANEINQRDNLPVNTKLTCLVQIVAIYYRQGDFQNAEKILKEFRDDMDNAEDKYVFAVKERYSASAIERSRGNYHEAWKIIEEGLILAHNAPAGFIPAAVYANAASILSSLVDDESFIDTSKVDKDLKSQLPLLVEMGKSFCHHAMQHLLYIDYDFEIAREDLRQRINITLASLHLKSADPNLSLISTPDEIERAEQSLMKRKGKERLTYNTCRQLLVKSDIYFQKYRLEPTDRRIEHWKKSLKYVQDAQTLADEKCFKEIKRLCEKRMQKINVDQTKPMEHNEEERTKKIVDEFFS